MLAPRVDKLSLSLTNIDLDRFGKWKGKMVHEVGDSFRKLLSDLLDDQEGKLVVKINREIDRQWEEGTLRVPLTGWMTSNLPSFLSAMP